MQPKIILIAKIYILPASFIDKFSVFGEVAVDCCVLWKVEKTTFCQKCLFYYCNADLELAELACCLWWFELSLHTVTEAHLILKIPTPNDNPHSAGEHVNNCSNSLFDILETYIYMSNFTCKTICKFRLSINYLMGEGINQRTALLCHTLQKWTLVLTWKRTTQKGLRRFKWVQTKVCQLMLTEVQLDCHCFANTVLKPPLFSF